MLSWFRFIRVMRKVTHAMDTPIETLNLNRYQFDVLMTVAFEPGINQKTCAERLNVSKGNITQHLDTLGDLGLIRRKKVGRENQLVLSSKGQETIEEFMPIHDDRVREILSPLTSEDINSFQAILRKLDRSSD